MKLYLHLGDKKIPISDKFIKKGNIPKSLQNIIKKHKREISYHFKSDGYDLSADYYVDDIIFKHFGFDIKFSILSELVTSYKNLEVVYKNGWMLRIPGDKVFMSPKGKLYVSKDYKNIKDSYIGEF